MISRFTDIQATNNNEENTHDGLSNLITLIIIIKLSIELFKVFIYTHKILSMYSANN